DLAEVIIDAGESAKSLNRPGMERLLSLVDAGAVNTVIIAKLDRLTRSVKDLAELLERFTRRGVSLGSLAESLDTGTAAGRLVLNIMTAVSQWEREAIGERTRDAMLHHGGGVTGLHLLADKLIRRGVVMAFHVHVIVQSDPDLLPLREHVGLAGQ